MTGEEANRLRSFSVTPEFLGTILRQMATGGIIIGDYKMTLEGFPSDVEFLEESHFDPYLRRYVMYCRSATFGEVPTGEMIPSMDLTAWRQELVSQGAGYDD